MRKLYNKSVSGGIFSTDLSLTLVQTVDQLYIMDLILNSVANFSILVFSFGNYCPSVVNFPAVFCL